MVQIKKITKYSKYFLFLAVASLASFVLAERSGGSLSDIPYGGVVPVVYADVPGGDGDAGAGDCDAGDAGCG